MTDSRQQDMLNKKAHAEQLKQQCEGLIRELKAMGGVKSRSKLFELSVLLDQVEDVVRSGNPNVDLVAVQAGIGVMHTLLHPEIKYVGPVPEVKAPEESPVPVDIRIEEVPVRLDPSVSDKVEDKVEVKTEEKIAAPPESEAMRQIEEEIYASQIKYITRINNYYEVYAELKRENGAEFRALPAWVHEHMEYIHQVSKTGQAWINEPRNEATSMERIQAYFKSPLFNDHIKPFQENAKVEYEMMLRWPKGKKTAGGKWTAIMDAKLELRDKDYHVPESYEIEPIQRGPRFPLLLNEFIKQAKKSGQDTAVIEKITDDVKTKVSAGNKITSTQPLFRKVSAEMERAGLPAETVNQFSAWPADLHNIHALIEQQIAAEGKNISVPSGTLTRWEEDLANETRKAPTRFNPDRTVPVKEEERLVNIHIAGLRGRLKNSALSENDKVKIESEIKHCEEFRNLTAKKIKVEEKLIKIEKKFDEELSNILKSSLPGNENYASRLDSLVNKTICPMFAHLKLRIQDDFKTRGLLVHVGTALNVYNRPEPEQLIVTNGIFGSKTREHGKSVDVDFEAGAPTTADSLKNTGASSLPFAGENEPNANERHNKGPRM